MTQIKHQYNVVRRPGELGVHSLDHMAMTVPDMDVATSFYNAFGLQTKVIGNEVGLFTFDNPHQWGVLLEGKNKQLQHLSFGVFEEDFGPFKTHIEKMGVKLLDPPPGMNSEGIWIRDPDGTLLELKIAQKTSLDTKSVGKIISSPEGIAGAPKRSEVDQVKPSRLAHILIFTCDVLKSLEFYHRVLGLRLSDKSGNDVAFMHGIHGSDHHLLAFARSNAPGLHHCSWDVDTLNEIGLGAMQMAGKGFSDGWGLGRHVLGSNYFHYVRDPWGSYAEYSCDMDYIPVDQDWEAGDHEADDAFYVWGPKPPEDWTHNHEADGKR